MSCIEFHEVQKSFGSKKALDGLSFDVECQESVALIGPNGAGKSTTLKILAGLIKPDSGEVKIGGFDPDSIEAKRIMGYLPEDASPYLTLSVKENLEYIGALRKTDGLEQKVEFLLNIMELNEYRNSRVSTLSRGNRQKLSIALAIIHDPKIMLLDEPLNYLDIPTQERIIKYFKGMNATFLVSTHIMSIAERFTKSALIINNGRLVWSGQIDELKEMSRQEDMTVEGVISKIMGES
ncbi:ABC transporter ATP-binding protein [Thermoplasma sp.]|uniref:ABC transporter ATP-binding protein n=1 Tax=Thermoplasma sp. TaxID=1973142 RepID=UPI0012736DD8|nr:ABC transporter ATP-binding protein [Thermoplasma sp.]KAA8922586.1 MAG: ABC transporter ATP-binding protein [Thermoplasma sp.]